MGGTSRSSLLLILASLALASPALAQGEKPLTAAEQEEDAALKKKAIDAREAGKYDESIAAAERLLALRERRHGKEHDMVAAGLLILSRALVAKADFARAEASLLRALAIRERSFGPETVKVGDVLGTLGGLEHERERYDRAIAYYERCLAIYEKGLGPNHLDIGRTLNNLAGVYIDIADFARAEPLLLRALAIKEKALEPTSPGVASSVNNLANLYFQRGDYKKSKELYQRSLAVWEKTLGPEHPNTAVALENLAGVASKLGEFAAGESLRRRVLTIREKALGPEHPFVARGLDNLAGDLVERGDYAAAEPLFLRALAIREKTLGPRALDVADTCLNAGELYKRRADLARAEAMTRRALAIREEVLGADKPPVAEALTNLAAVLIDKGDLAGAEPMLSRALTIRRQTLSPDHPDVAASLHALGDLFVAKNDAARAERRYLDALAIREKSLGKEHVRVAETLSGLSVVAMLALRMDDAVKLRARDAAIRDRHLSITLAAGAEDQKRAYMEALADATDATISLNAWSYNQDPAARRLAFTTLLRRKGRVLEATAQGIAALRRHLDPEGQRLLDELALIDAEIAVRVARDPGAQPLDRYRAAIDALDQKRRAIEAQVSAKSAAFRADEQPITLDQITAAIPAGAALVEIVRYRPFVPGTRPGATWKDPRYAAYIVKGDGALDTVDLGDAKAIDAAARRLRDALADPDLRHDPKPAARALDQLAFAAIRARLGSTRWVFLSPDGELNLIPFAALVDGEGRYAIERYLFTYLTSGRDLMRLRGARPERQPALIFADPDFGPLPKASSTRGGSGVAALRFPALPETRAEARAVKRALGGAPLRLGKEATKEALRSVAGPKVLHLATHGFFLPSGGQGPMLRAGLALSGANTQGAESSILTALEASALDLDGTRLVVLSACQTGLGDAMSGEGVYGLRRALVMAGAETQVMSLWNVDSAATSTLMASYYARLRAGAGRSEAMRDVQLAMMDGGDDAHPNRWAAFIVSGNGASMEGKLDAPAVARAPYSPRGCACSVDEAPGDRALGLSFTALLLSARLLRRRARRGW